MTAPCGSHAGVISLCGGELYCFLLMLSQSNNLLGCPLLALSCYSHGPLLCLWTFLVNRCSGWVSQRSVSPLAKATCRWVELFILEPLSGWLRASGCTASSYWCHSGFSGINTLRMFARVSWLFVSQGRRGVQMTTEIFKTIFCFLVPFYAQ